MTTPAQRGAQLTAWYRARLDDPSVTVEVTGTPTAGYSNEVLFSSVRRGDDSSDEQVVVRLPPTGPPLFPAYDLGMQVAVQRFAARAGVPVPAPIVLEEDEAWLGAPFLVMPRVMGRDPGEVPATCEWLLALSLDDQRAVEVGFLDALATLHRAAVADVDGVRDPGSLAGELDWWDDFADFACGGADPAPLRELFAWCRAHLPTEEPPSSVLWGDVRLGNAIIAPDGRPAAILDWEMASIGPAEMDLAWYTSQARMMARFFGATVPGFLDPDEAIAHHAQQLGRPVQDMAWHERFAMARSAAVHHRSEVVAALAEGRDVPSAADSFLITYTTKQFAKPT